MKPRELMGDGHLEDGGHVKSPDSPDSPDGGSLIRLETNHSVLALLKP